MAWFKDAENGSSAPAVTVERIHRALSALGFAMGPMETPAKLVAKFDGYVTVLDVSNPTFLMIRAHFPAADAGAIVAAPPPCAPPSGFFVVSMGISALRTCPVGRPARVSVWLVARPPAFRSSPRAA